MSYKFLDEGKKHLHTLSEKPLIGTTTLIKEVHPPMLSWYGSGKALELLGWLNSKTSKLEERLKSAGEKLAQLVKMSCEDYLALLDNAYKNHDTYKKSQGKSGVNFHKIIESFIFNCIAANDGVPKKEINPDIQSFIDWAQENVKKFLWTEGYCYSEKLWVGGCADFGFISKNDEMIIGDCKTAKDIYWTNLLQCAAYGIQIKENGIFTKDGKELLPPIEKIDGYLVFQQKNKGEPKTQWSYDVARLEKIFTTDVETYKAMQEFKQK